MRSRKANVILCILLVAVVSVFFGIERGWAAAKKEIVPAKIGVVNVRKVFEQCAKNVGWQGKMAKERDVIMAELKKLSAEIDAIEADLPTRKPGSEDYMKLIHQKAEKAAILQSKSQVYQTELVRAEAMHSESMYKEVIAVVAEVAKLHGLDAVIAKDEFELPPINPDNINESIEQLMLLIRTNKLLYNNDEMEITDDVLTALDSKK